jgi:hypothetical protein
MTVGGINRECGRVEAGQPLRGRVRPLGCWARAAGLGAALLLAAVLLIIPGPTLAQLAPAGPGSALKAKRAELLPQLRNSRFGEPLLLMSRDEQNRAEGEVYAEIEHPIEQVAAVFKSPASVCELLFLHLNVHACQPSISGAVDVLSLEVGPKRAGAMGSTYRMAYALRTESAVAGHLRVTLTAAEGPLATHHYRIVVEAVPLEDGRSFVHLSYAYSHGFVARMAMGAYLATAGREKIGFTLTGQGAQAAPVRGERAALERNVMRYYLALLAHCRAATRPPAERTEARLTTWFALTEKHAAQLHEFDLAEYLQEKHEDLARAASQGR